MLLALPVPLSPTMHISVSYDRDVIRDGIRKHLDEVRACYEAELTTTPDLRGRMTTSFTIAPDGSVSASNKAESTLASPQVEDCVLAAERTWHFLPPRSSGNVVVQYPFVFEPATPSRAPRR